MVAGNSSFYKDAQGKRGRLGKQRGGIWDATFLEPEKLPVQAAVASTSEIGHLSGTLGTRCRPCFFLSIRQPFIYLITMEASGTSSASCFLLLFLIIRF